MDLSSTIPSHKLDLACHEGRLKVAHLPNQRRVSFCLLGPQGGVKAACGFADTISRKVHDSLLTGSAVPAEIPTGKRAPFSLIGSGGAFPGMHFLISSGDSYLLCQLEKKEAEALKAFLLAARERAGRLDAESRARSQRARGNVSTVLGL